MIVRTCGCSRRAAADNQIVADDLAVSGHGRHAGGSRPLAGRSCGCVIPSFAFGHGDAPRAADRGGYRQRCWTACATIAGGIRRVDAGRCSRTLGRLGPNHIAARLSRRSRSDSSGGVEERAVVGLDHADARAHDPGEFVHRDPGRERVRRERRAEVVQPRGPSRSRTPRPPDSSSRFRKFATSNGPPLSAREHVGRVETRDERIERDESRGRSAEPRASIASSSSRGRWRIRRERSTSRRSRCADSEACGMTWIGQRGHPAVPVRLFGLPVEQVSRLALHPERERPDYPGVRIVGNSRPSGRWP